MLSYAPTPSSRTIPPGRWARSFCQYVSTSGSTLRASLIPALCRATCSAVLGSRCAPGALTTCADTTSPVAAEMILTVIFP